MCFIGILWNPFGLYLLLFCFGSLSQKSTLHLSHVDSLPCSSLLSLIIFIPNHCSEKSWLNSPHSLELEDFCCQHGWLLHAVLTNTNKLPSFSCFLGGRQNRPKHTTLQSSAYCSAATRPKKEARLNSTQQHNTTLLDTNENQMNIRLKAFIALQN